VWVDEFRDDKEQVGKDKLGVLHNSFNRAGQAKYQSKRDPALDAHGVHGIGREHDERKSAIRGRFPHVQISKHLRQWAPGEKEKGGRGAVGGFSSGSKSTGIIFFSSGATSSSTGRNIVEKGVQCFSRIWNGKNMDPRCRVIHGVGYASWMAMVSLLESHSGGRGGSPLREHMVQHSKTRDGRRAK
jgi:hypothetical protein